MTITNVLEKVSFSFRMSHFFISVGWFTTGLDLVNVLAVSVLETRFAEFDFATAFAIIERAPNANLKAGSAHSRTEHLGDSRFMSRFFEHWWQ